MTGKDSESGQRRDLLALSKAPLSELLEALAKETSLREPGAAAPPRANQIARLVVAEAVRLIRLGTQSEVVDAAAEISRAIMQPKMKELAKLYPDAMRRVEAASVMLGAAAPASSGGGELTVLRSWNGKAREALAIINQEPSGAIQRADLRAKLGVDESYLSHLLRDLEGAGLIDRVRFGRRMKVRLAPKALSEHVQDQLTAVPDPRWNEKRDELAKRARKRLVAGSAYIAESPRIYVDLPPRIAGFEPEPDIQLGETVTVEILGNAGWEAPTTDERRQGMSIDLQNFRDHRFLLVAGAKSEPS